jgi:hypothetical protein
MIQILKNIGIDVGLLVSGLFGTILLLSRNSSDNLKTTIFSIFAGAASANYITPIILDFVKINTPNANYAIAFLLGFLGLKGVEIMSERVFGKSLLDVRVRNKKTKKYKKIL